MLILTLPSNIPHPTLKDLLPILRPYKHLKAQDSSAIKAAYTRFTAHFHNPAIQENIRSSKEEQFQGEFLIDLFVNILGYTKNPIPGFNITTEYKNVKDSKKADGAILVNGVVKAVIKLKGTDTTDLGRVEAQAFGHKVNQPDCVYVPTIVKSSYFKFLHNFSQIFFFASFISYFCEILNAL